MTRQRQQGFRSPRRLRLGLGYRLTSRSAAGQFSRQFLPIALRCSEFGFCSAKTLALVRDDVCFAEDGLLGAFGVVAEVAYAEGF